MKFREWLKHFFFSNAGGIRWRFIIPFIIVMILIIFVLSGGVYAWDYTNSPKFCGTTCHTMPPQNSTYIQSPHANVYCTECHIGRAFVGDQFARKSEDLREIYAQVFHTYEFPIIASRSRPARETCEKCHLPEAFTGDSLSTISHFADDENNSFNNIYLLLKTGGGTEEKGLGRGIHWHTINKVEYYATDDGKQTIPYIRVNNKNGTVTEYVDVESDVDPKKLSEDQLIEMDCVTCHNRVTHDFQYPKDAIDSAMARGLIDPEIPNIHQKVIQVLTTNYSTHEEAVTAINSLKKEYENADNDPVLSEQIEAAFQIIQEIYDRTVFEDQRVDWTTHPNNIGHINTPGCFRCHDGKHLDAAQHAIRLECNLCHSIPIATDAQDFVVRIEISLGLEPESHLNPNWISLHNQVFDNTCSNCHTVENMGGTSNTSFCSNSICHGNVYTYAGFDAPALRELLAAQLPSPPSESTPTPEVVELTYNGSIGSLFKAKCTGCHGAAATAGLNLSSYADAMKGSKNGPVILAGDSKNSKIVAIQSGQHFANFSSTELDLIIQWIDAGAPEQ